MSILSLGNRIALGIAALATTGIPIIADVYAPTIRAQTGTDWQTKAGGKVSFEVASVKPGKGAVAPSNLPLTPWDDYSATNGRFLADATLSTYIQFAYKVWPNDLQSRELSHLPKWADSDRYIIEARAATAIRPRTRCVS